MSTHYYYYIGYKLNDKIYPLGPYNSNGKLCDTTHHSRNHEHEIQYGFYYMNPDLASDELREDLYGITEREWSDEDLSHQIKWLPFSELPTGSPVKSGYYLIKDVIGYQEGTLDADDVFYDHLTPEAYAAKLSVEMALGHPPADKVDCEDNPIHVPSASEYMYFTYIDEYCDEFICHQLRRMKEVLYDEYDMKKLGKEDAVPVVILFSSY